MPSVRPLQVDRLRALPKAEIHAHLEGCFEPGVLEQWAKQARVPMPRPRERLFEFEGLADFLHFLDWACGLASTRERLAELSYGLTAADQDRLPPIRFPYWKGPGIQNIESAGAFLPSVAERGN